jgi:hypothetical protein
MERFVSEPYISLASGNLCVTISCWFSGPEGRQRILCADFDVQPLAWEPIPKQIAAGAV